MIHIVLNNTVIPLLALMPRSAKSAPCFAKTSLKKTLTQWPKIMGSDTCSGPKKGKSDGTI